jgi:glycosyltransferase involved in cell wall biosynthesis
MEKAIQGLAENQVKIGHKVYVVTSLYGAGNRPSKEILNNVNIHRIKAWRLHYPDLTIPKEIPVELLKKADIVHVHGHNSLFCMKILSEAFKVKVKSACYFMALESFGDHPNMLIRLLAPHYDRENTKKALKIADLPLVKSMRDLKILVKRYGMKAEYLPDGIPDCYFTVKKEDSIAFREKFGIRHEKFFLFIGRMHKLKGPHILVKALNYINEDIATIFIGPDGGYLKEILDLAERINVRDRVYYLGCIDEKAKIQALDSAMALVLPSLANYVEVYPMVISEAWARGKPVIASRVGGIPYRVKQYVNGVLVNPSDPKMLAEAMLKIVNNDELAKEMGRNGRKEVFSWREIAMRSIQLYKQVLKDR